MSSNKKRKQMDLNQRLLMLIGDERSLLGAGLLGIIESTCRQTAHNATNTDKPWGGIPVVILMGDDGQLPSVQKGAFCALNPPASTHEEYAGYEVFKQLAHNVRDLSTLKRQDETQIRLRHILDGLYTDTVCIEEG